MSITAADVNRLRQATGAGMMDCKKALTETGGDFEQAIDLLRKKGQKVSAKRSDREATEGVAIAKTSADQKTGIVIELGCETDFVAKNDDFVAFAQQIADLALINKPADLDALKAIELNGLPIAERIDEQIGKIGEKIEVSNYKLVEGDNIVSYIHAGYRIGVLVAMNLPSNEANLEAGKDVAMQVAAMNPVALDKDQVDASIVEREMEIGREQARAEGKPEQIIDKIAEGKLNKFYKESTLLNQQFVKDGSQTVSQMLDGVEKGLTITSFIRVAIGG